MFSRIRIRSPAFFSHFCRKESLKLGLNMIAEAQLNRKALHPRTKKPAGVEREGPQFVVGSDSGFIGSCRRRACLATSRGDWRGEGKSTLAARSTRLYQGHQGLTPDRNNQEIGRV